MKYCPYCGAGLAEEMRFCPRCGKPFENGKENPHIAEKTTFAEPVINATHASQSEAEQPPKKKNRGGLVAIAAIVVAIAIVGTLFASGAFAPKEEPVPTEEPVIPFTDNTNAIEQASQSVVMLSCYDKDGELYATGSGFAVFDDGVIVTNYHVIEQEVYRIKAETESGSSFECPTVLAYDADKDIAILKADRNTGLTLLPVGSTGGLQKGAKVVAIGSPLGLINSVSTGVFSGYIDDKAGKLLQFTAAISHGSSGGALFNDAGEVIGVTFASLTEGQSLNLAVPIEDVKALYGFAGSQKAMSIEAFYDTFEHIPTYSLGYLLVHSKELDQQVVIVDGFVSAIEENKVDKYYRLWLSDSPDNLINRYFVVTEANAAYSQEYYDTLSQMNRNEILVVYPEKDQYETILRQFQLGEHIIVCGKVEWDNPENFVIIHRTIMYINRVELWDD